MLGDNLRALGMANQQSLQNQMGLGQSNHDSQMYMNDMSQAIAMSFGRRFHIPSPPSTIDEMQSDVSLWLKDWDK